MTMPDFFTDYEDLAARADRAFTEMSGRYPSCVSCTPHCSDCCHAVFGVFLLEAAFLRYHFEKLGRKERRQATLRADQAEKEMGRLLREAHKGEEPRGSYSLEKARIRCPLLDEDHGCILYPYRPITCRVYGIPTAIQGKAHVCWKAKFDKEKAYPAFNLDEVQGKLYHLSREFLEMAGGSDPDKASLLVSVSKVITTWTPDLVREIFL
jgi:Fe-S-cluster containining protein